MSVYALKDPRDGRARYVGRSTQPRLRLRMHVRRPHSKRLRDWIAELSALGLAPELAVLEGATEREWIVRLDPDLNQVAGLGGYEPPAKTRQTPPVRVSADDMSCLRSRAGACDLTVTEYVRYRTFGKRVLTGEQIERVKKNEKLID